MDKNSNFSENIRHVAGNLIKDIKYLDKENRFIYITKLSLDPTSKVCFFGDIHGCIHTLIRSILRLIVLGYILPNFIFSNNFHIVFLGDLVDRGIYGIEILYLIMKLKILNPKNIHIIRGNHEECCTSTQYMFKNEFSKICEPKDLTTVYVEYCKTWLYLPVAIFLNINNKYIQLCHGGLLRSPTFIKNFLESTQQIHAFIARELPKINKLIKPHELGDLLKDFQWSDFSSIDISQELLQQRISSDIFGANNEKGRRCYAANEVIEYMKICNLNAIIRGHEDTIDNTKLLMSPPIDNNKESMGIENYYDIEKIKSNDHSSFKIKLPSQDSIDTLNQYVSDMKFVPVITFTTGLPSRMVDCDGFGILDLVTNVPDLIGGKYKKYLYKYKMLKKIENKTIKKVINI